METNGIEVQTASMCIRSNRHTSTDFEWTFSICDSPELKCEDDAPNREYSSD